MIMRPYLMLPVIKMFTQIFYLSQGRQSLSATFHGSFFVSSTSCINADIIAFGSIQKVSQTDEFVYGQTLAFYSAINFLVSGPKFSYE